jgi:myo-inositol-1(or 4)-monophosphatase
MNTPRPSTGNFLQFAIETATEAGGILLEEFERPPKISYKGEADIVTQADKRSEAAIVSRIQKNFADHGIVAEEGGRGAANSRYVWHVDPLDGTTNFAHKFPVFAVSIGLLEEGEPIAGVVLNPWARELFTAARGEGATLNGKKIDVSSVDTLANALVATGFPAHKRGDSHNINYYWEFTLRSHGVRRAGSAAVDMCNVACGRYDGYWEFGIKSWDTAAGTLIVREAGGLVTDFAGAPYRPGGPVVLASNGGVHEEMRQLGNEITARRKA